MLLRLEGAVTLTLALSAYAHLGGSWGWFAALFSAPGPLAARLPRQRPRVGAVAYNAAHSYVGPALLALVALKVGAPSWLLGVAIWVAHVGFDRAMGYGLKYATAFGDTPPGARRPRAPLRAAPIVTATPGASRQAMSHGTILACPSCHQKNRVPASRLGTPRAAVAAAPCCASPALCSP